MLFSLFSAAAGSKSVTYSGIWWVEEGSDGADLELVARSVMVTKACYA